jgi:DNA end-binding protein Ku
MRSIWSGALTFGLVNIPVKLFVATEERSLDLDMLHKKDMSPIRFARVCKVEEKEIPYDQLTRGFELDTDDYVVLTDEELQKANVKKTKSIEIQAFVKESEIDTLLFEKPYYLEPAKGAEKSYALLFEALKKAKKVGVAKFVLRSRERIAIVKPYKNALMVEQLRYMQDIRTTEDLNLPVKQSVTQREITMALAFIEQLTEKFEPQKYKDTYKQELEKIIKAKAKGQKVTGKGKEPVPTKVNDLMAQLKASLEMQQRASQVQ